MATSKSKIGREELVSKVQSRLKLKTKKEADYIINEVVAAPQVYSFQVTSKQKISP